jgi:general secretion pathway protein G
VLLRKVRINDPRAAFTLMEMLVVVAIIVMLAGLGTWGYMRYLETARLQKAKMDCVHISQAVEAYNLETGQFPSTLQELTQPVAGRKAFLEQNQLQDPWGKPYNFDPNQQSATGKPKVFTIPPGGQEINNWQ